MMKLNLKAFLQNDFKCPRIDRLPHCDTSNTKMGARVRGECNFQVVVSVDEIRQKQASKLVLPYV